MSLIGKLIISLVVAGIASTLLGLFHGGDTPSLVLFGAFAAATVATALLTSISISKTSAATNSIQGSEDTPAGNFDSADREEGEVKWFNVTKGFGFITRDNGEEIFVHFRSIRGEGRRSLRDGQRVSYTVTDSDKGPQAEDVEGLG